MTIADRYLAKEIYKFTGIVLVAMVGLFTFFSILDRIDQVTAGKISLGYFLLLQLLYIPRHIYDIMPVSILIGSIIALAGLSQRSELVILRVSGLSGFRILRGIVVLTIPMYFMAFLFSEWVIPKSESQFSAITIMAKGSISSRDALRSGFWFRESIGDQYRIINIDKVEADRSMSQIQIYQYSNDGKGLQAYIHAQTGKIDKQFLYLQNVSIQDLSQLAVDVKDTRSTPALSTSLLAEYVLPTSITADLVFARVLPPERMSIFSLWSYIQFLEDNHIVAERQTIAFWSKIVYPLSLMVMLAIATPIAFIHTRKGGVGSKVFIGILIGVVFYVFNQFMLNFGVLQKWPSWLSALMPSFVALSSALLVIFILEFQNKWHVWIRNTKNIKSPQ